MTCTCEWCGDDCERLWQIPHAVIENDDGEYERRSQQWVCIECREMWDDDLVDSRGNPIKQHA